MTLCTYKHNNLPQLLWSHTDIPEMVRCGGDEIAFHVPEATACKIRQHEFVNLAVCSKGAWSYPSFIVVI